MSVLLKNKQGEALYAIASHRFTRGKWVPQDMVYVHALDVANARMRFLQGENGRPTKIIACAPAIGYHAQDDNADVVST